MKKKLFSMNNAQLRYALVVAGIMFLLALLLWFNLIKIFYDGDVDSFYIFATVFICLITLLTLIGAFFLLRKDNGLILHIAVVCTSAYNIYLSLAFLLDYYYSYDDYSNFVLWLAPTIIACLLFLFYIGGFFALKRKRQTPENDRLYLFGMALLTATGLLIDIFSWQPETVYMYSDELGHSLYNTVFTLRMMPSMFGVFLILIPLIYLPFYLTKNIKPAVSYTAMGIAVLLTLIDIGTTSFSYNNSAQFFGNLILVIGIITAYIVYDRIMLSNKNKTEGNPTASGKTDALSFDEKAEQLHDLQTLREAGILTEEEFQTQKQKILGGNKHV